MENINVFLNWTAKSLNRKLIKSQTYFGSELDFQIRIQIAKSESRWIENYDQIPDSSNDKQNFFTPLFPFLNYEVNQLSTCYFVNDHQSSVNYGQLIGNISDYITKFSKEDSNTRIDKSSIWHSLHIFCL